MSTANSEVSSSTPQRPTGRWLASYAVIVAALTVILDGALMGLIAPAAAWGMVALYFVIRMASIRYDLRTRPVLGDPP